VLTLDQKQTPRLNVAQKGARFAYTVKLQLMHSPGAGGVEQSLQALIAIYLRRCVINDDGVEFDALGQICRYDDNTLFIFSRSTLHKLNFFDIAQCFVCSCTFRSGFAYNRDRMIGEKLFVYSLKSMKRSVRIRLRNGFNFWRTINWPSASISFS
jgi:hypothetical protein